MKKPSIYLPIIDNGMSLGQTPWAVSMMGLCLSQFFNRDRKIVVDPISYPYPSGAMNVMTDRFLREGCDEMLVIDTDVAFRPEHVEMLLSHDVPLVFGLYPKKKPGLEWPVMSLDGENPFGGDSPLVEVKCCARGFMRVKREVFLDEKLKSISSEYIDPDTKLPHNEFWELMPGGHSEDFKFCEKYRSIGGKVMVDQRILATHMGIIAFPIPGTY